MSQLFSTPPEDPWALPSPKESSWPTAGATHDEPLEEQDDNDQAVVASPTRASASAGSPLIGSGSVIGDNPLESSVWGGDVQAASVLKDNGDEETPAMPLGNNMGSEDFHAWSEAVRGTYSATSADVVHVSEMAEREGLLFKHTNYLVEHHVALDDTDAQGEKKVVRRYSDFVWLLEVLLKRYPFRLVPELPPKKLASNSDKLFLEKRRRGLARFLNALVRHPVLRREPLVVMFLTVPTDLAGWRRQAQYDTSEEYRDRKSLTTFETMWNGSKTEFETMMNNAESELPKAVENWNKICVLVERLCVRQKQIAQDQHRLAECLSGFKSSTVVLYPVEDTRTPQINEGLKDASKHIEQNKKIIEEESDVGDEEVLEEFKRLLDFLLALRALFDRYNRLGGNTIYQLSKRVEQNKHKLSELQGKPDVKGAEVDRITDAIAQDEKEIKRQTNRDWLIKESLLTEYVLFQESQFQITRSLQYWARDRLGFTEQQMDNWTKFSSVMQDMPMSRSD